ncbi:hypothetical protein Ddc_23333 [Ditylenchus destructor]|nr:hypothetical protein Ddc_23333 [Ditylenchus destructor]
MYTSFISAIQDVKALIDQFGTLSSTSADAMMYVQKLSFGASLFLKTAFPVGSLIATCLTIASKQTSPEYEALLKLQRSVVDGFANLDSTVRFSTAVINMQKALDDYFNAVDVPFHKMLDKVLDITNPAINKTELDIEKFTNSCLGDESGPLGILLYMELALVDRCNHSINPDDAFLTAAVYESMRDIKRTAESPIFESTFEEQKFAEERSDITIILHRVNNYTRAIDILKMAKGKMTRQSKKFPTITKSIAAFKDEISILVLPHMDDWISEEYDKKAVAPIDKCILQRIVEGTGYHSNPIYQFANRVRGDLLEAMLYSGVCSKLTYKNPGEIERYRLKIENKILRISNFIVKWIPEKLNTSFPAIERERVKEIMGNQSRSIAHNKDAYTVIDMKLNKELSLIGHPRYFYQTLVTLNGPLDEYIYVHNCLPTRCFTVYDTKDVHIVVTKFFLDDEPRTVAAQQFLNNARKTILQVIDANYNINSLNALAKEIQKKASLTYESGFRTAVITREAEPPLMGCGVLYHYTSFEMESPQTEGVGFIAYHYAGGIFAQCEDFKLFFFI